MPTCTLHRLPPAHQPNWLAPFSQIVFLDILHLHPTLFNNNNYSDTKFIFLHTIVKVKMLLAMGLCKNDFALFTRVN